MTVKGLTRAIVLMLAASSTFASGTVFEDITPMASEVGEATLPEAMPYKLSSPHFSARR
jgi:hypothetical protein